MAVSLKILRADGSTLHASCSCFGLSLLFARNSRHVEAVSKLAQERRRVDGASLHIPLLSLAGSVFKLKHRSCHLVVELVTYHAAVARLLLPSENCGGMRS
jgi:hypothetical protein